MEVVGSCTAADPEGAPVPAGPGCGAKYFCARGGFGAFCQRPCAPGAPRTQRVTPSQDPCRQQRRPQPAPDNGRPR